MVVVQSFVLVLIRASIFIMSSLIITTKLTTTIFFISSLKF